MGLTQRLNQEWLSHNSSRKYPLAMDASAKDLTGDFKLPNDFLVGLRLAVPMMTNPAGFFVQTIQAFSTGYAVTIGYWNGSEAITVAIGSVLKSAHTLYKTYPLRGIGDFYDAIGHMTIGRFDDIDAQPPGEWSFEIESGRLEVDAISPMIRGVSLRVQNGQDLSLPITGNVILSAGTNTRITLVQVSGEDPEIVFDAIEGEGLNEDCVCDGDNEVAPPIRTINGIPPTTDGNLVLVGSSCLDIQPVENGLRLDDKCAEPCCGCKELEKVTSALEGYGQQAATLENFVNSLLTQVQQMQQVVLGSRLNDQGCFTG